MIHEQRTSDAIWPMSSGLTTRVGQRKYIRGQIVQKLSFPLKKKGAPTGDVTFTVRKTDDTVILTKVACDAADLTTELIWYEAIFDTSAFIDEEVRISAEYGGGNVGNFVSVGYNTSDVIADEKLALYSTPGPVWSDIAHDDVAYSYTYEPCIFVAASSDDCIKDSLAAYFSLVSLAYYAGYFDVTYKTGAGGARFLDVPIPPGATILEARLRLTARASLANAVVNTRIRCQKHLDPLTFSTIADFDARNWTTAYTNWDAIPAWTANTIYTSADFKTPLQEVIDQADWQIGSAVAVLWDDFEQRSTQANNTYREAYSFDGAPDKAPQLYVRFEIPPPSYRVYIDWEDNTLNSLYGNVSGDVKLPINWQIGKNEELGKVDAGTAELVLTNYDYKYSPEYAASPLYGYVRPGKMVTINGYHDGIMCPLYHGRINEIVPHPHPEEQEVYFYLVDDMDIWATARVSLPLYENQRTGYLFGKILDEIGWDANKRQIAQGSVAPKYFWASEEYALDKIHQLEDIEGGMAYVDHRGYAVWEDRYYRQTAPRTFSQYTITRTTNIDYKYNLRNIINVARGSYIIQTYQDSAFPTRFNADTYPPEGMYYKRVRLQLASSNPLVWVADYEWAVEHMFASGRYRLGYYTGSDAHWVDSDATITFKGNRIDVHFNTVHCTTPWLCAVYFEGFPLEETGKLVIEETDATSITEYGRRHYYIDIPLSTSEAKLKALLKRVIARNKDVRVTDMPISLINYSDEMWNQLLERHVSDKITLQNTPLGLDDNYFINKEIHTLSEGRVHETTWILEKVVAGYYWTLGLSELGIGTRLGY